MIKQADEILMSNSLNSLFTRLVTEYEIIKKVEIEFQLKSKLEIIYIIESCSSVESRKMKYFNLKHHHSH